jgi:hypothetical protein
MLYTRSIVPISRLRDYNASVGALTPPPDLFHSQTGATMQPDHGKNVVAPVHGKTVSWNI